MEQDLYNWFVEQQKKIFPVRGKLLQEKAKNAR